SVDSGESYRWWPERHLVKVDWCLPLLVSPNYEVYAARPTIAAHAAALSKGVSTGRSIAVGTSITGRPPQLGRIEARTGLRMMPTSPRSSLSFRTAGFPQYGWEGGVLGEAFPARYSA